MKKSTEMIAPFISRAHFEHAFPEPALPPVMPTTADLLAEITRLKGEAGVLKALLTLSRRTLDVAQIDADDSHEAEMLAELIGKIDAALAPARTAP